MLSTIWNHERSRGQLFEKIHAGKWGDMIEPILELSS